MLRHLFFLVAPAVIAPLLAAGPVVEHAETFFVAPGETSSLGWTGGEGPVGYSIFDFDGRVVGGGVAMPAADGSGRFTVPVNLPRGYYEIRLGQGADAPVYGVVSQDAFTGPADPFFGIDAVITWLERRPELRASLVKIIKRGGIGIARERFRLSGVNPAADKWNWAEHERADALRTLYRDAGVPVLEMFHDAGPARGEDTVPSRYPRDLVALSRPWSTLYERWTGSWAGIEAWNEPDGPGYGGGLPADQYLPLVRTMRWSLQQAGVGAPLGGGVLIGSDPGDYHANLVQNGLLDCVDFVSFHDYRRAADMQGLVALYRRWMRDSGREGMPLWLTEVGFPWSKGPGRPPFDEDRRSALEITMKGVEARACGIARFMPFCLPFYEEGGVKNFAMLGREATPLRSMAAYLQSIRALAHRPYVGDLRFPVGFAPARARVFAAAGDEADVVVLFTDSLTPARIVLPFSPLRAETIDGRPLAVAGDGAVVVPDGLAYVWVAPDAVAAHLDARTEAAALAASSHVASPAARAESPIILWHRINAGQIQYSPTRYLVSGENAAALSLTIRAANLSILPRRVRLTLTLPGAAADAALTRSVAVPAQGTTDVTWTVDARGALDIVRTLPLVVTGVTEDDGLPVGPVAAPFRIEGTLEQFTSRFPDRVELPVDRMERWTENVTRHGVMKMTSSGPGAWQFDARFKERGERWAYPKYRLDPGQLAGAKGLVLRLRAKEDAELRLMLFSAAGAGYWTSVPVAPADGRWHVAYVPFTDFEPLPSHPDPEGGKLDPARITSLAVGFHDRSSDNANTLELSNLLLIKDPIPQPPSSP